MAGRKRRMLASTVAAEPQQAVKKPEHRRGLTVTPAELKKRKTCGSAEPEQSPYFTRSDPQQQLRLGEDFFNQPCLSLAKAFLGKVLVRRCADGSELRGRIVETEAYLGGEDRASHSAGGKRTERNTAMFMEPGTIYVYPIYGIYLCMNVSSEGEGAAVLLRSLEPLQGQTAMRQRRAARRKEGARQLKDKELCNGPSKLCQALNIPRCFDRRDLASDHEVWLERDPDSGPAGAHDVVSAPRIGIQSHGEWAKKPWRFYLRGHPCVSVVNKEAERQFLFGESASSQMSGTLCFSEATTAPDVWSLPFLAVSLSTSGIPEERELNVWNDGYSGCPSVVSADHPTQFKSNPDFTTSST